MKVSQLFESVALGAGLIGGGMNKWKERWGATDADIQTAMRQARELPSYKELLKYTEETTSKKQARNGTIAFKSFRHATKKAYPYGNRPDSWKHGWNQTYVHFYGQVRTGTEGATYNSPVKSIPPRVYDGDPVRTIVGAYNNGFKVILNRFKHKRTTLPAEIVRRELTRWLQSKVDQTFTMVFDTGHRNFLIMPQNLFALSKELFKGDANRKVNFMADLIDDDNVGTSIRDNLMDRLRRKHEKALSTVGDKNDFMVHVANLINKEYKEYDVHAKAMLLSEYQDKYKMFDGDWDGVHKVIAEKVMVVDVRNNADDEEVEARNEK